MLEGLERDLKAVKKAREALGDAAPKFGSGGSRQERGERDGRGERGGMRGGRGGRGGGVLGKRRRDDGESSEESDVPEDVKSIPMPRDTPPPVPKEVLDKWYQKRRERIAAQYPSQAQDRSSGSRGGTNANNTPLGANDRGVGGGGREGGEAQKRVVEEAKTVYEAKPAIRDLRKEATSFVPAAVRMKLEKARGQGGLVEPEEADVLERAGYLGRKEKSEDVEGGAREGFTAQKGSRTVQMEEVDDEDG